MKLHGLQLQSFLSGDMICSGWPVNALRNSVCSQYGWTMNMSENQQMIDRDGCKHELIVDFRFYDRT